MDDLLKISEDQFKEYALEANTRSTISAQDGLKTIHRRILYSFLDQGLMSNKPHKVSATAVGQVLSLHPHGDAAVYDAAMRLSQDFKMRYPLIDVYGGNGSVINDAYAASRYTKIRLSKFGELMLRGIKKKAVPMVDNYSGDEKEPVYLPSVFPALLCNSNLGIGIGLSTGTASFNLKEVCNAIEAVIDNPNITAEDILTVLPAPDFPTGGVLLNTPEEILNIYKTGKGSYKLSCKYDTKVIDGHQHIIITEVPYLVSIEKHIIEPIKKMVNEEEYPFIDELQDLCGNNKIEFHIILTKGANLYQVKKDLDDRGILSTRIKINHTINKNRVFKTMSILEMINEYINNRHSCIINESIFDRNNAQDKLHILEGLIIALEDIDNVVNIIKKSKDRAAAQQLLIQTYPLDEAQAKAILDMRLAKLTSLEVDSLKQEINNLKVTIEQLNNVIKNKILREKLIKEDLKMLRGMSDGRKTTIQQTQQNEKVESEDILVFLEKENIKAIKKDKLTISNKGTKGSVISKEEIIDILSTQTNSTILAFDTEGNVTSIETNFIPLVEDLKDKGLPYKNFVNSGDIIKISNIEDKKYLICTTKNGYVKKSLVSDYKEFRKAQQALRLREDDQLLNVDFASEEDKLVLINELHHIVSLSIEELKTMGKITYGAKTPYSILSATVVEPQSTLLMWSDDGKGKFIEYSDLPESNKNSGGVVTTDNTCGVCATNQKKLISIIGTTGKGIIINSQDVSVKGIKTKGSKIYNGEIAKISML